MVFEKKQLSKVVAIALMIACAVAFMPLLNGQAFAAAKKPAKVKIKSAKQVTDTMNVKVTWKKAKNAKKYQVKVGSKTYTTKKKTYTAKNLAAGTYKVKVRGINGKKKGAWSATKKVTVVAPAPKEIPLTGVTISGTTNVGDTLTAVVAPEGAQATFEWQRVDENGEVVGIKNVEGNTYTLKPVDKNCTIRVIATGVAPYTGAVKSAEVGPVKDSSVDELKIVSATQTHAKVLEIVLNKEVSDETVKVTRNSAVQNQNWKLGADKKTITVTMTGNLIDAEYGLEVTAKTQIGVKDLEPQYGTQTAIGSVKCEPAKLTEVKFLGKELLPDSDAEEDQWHAYAILKGYDQFGDVMAFNPDKITAKGASEDVDYNPATGVLTLYKNAHFVKGEQVEVTVVYAGGTKTLKETLVVSDAAYCADLTIGDVTPAVARLTYEKLQEGEYYLPITAKNQYGTALTADELNDMIDAGTLFVTPTSNAVVYADWGGFDELADGSVVLYIYTSYDDVPADSGTISILSAGVGTPWTKTIEVAENEKIAEIEVTQNGLIAGDKRNELGVTLKNQYGEAMVLANEVEGALGDLYFEDGSYIEVAGTSADVIWEGWPSFEYANGKVYLDLGDVRSEGQINIVAHPIKGKDASFKFNINAPREAVFASDVNVGETKAFADLTDDALVDQYGGKYNTKDLDVVYAASLDDDFVTVDEDGAITGVLPTDEEEPVEVFYVLKSEDGFMTATATIDVYPTEVYVDLVPRTGGNYRAGDTPTVAVYNEDGVDVTKDVLASVKWQMFKETGGANEWADVEGLTTFGDASEPGDGRYAENQFARSIRAFVELNAGYYCEDLDEDGLVTAAIYERVQNSFDDSRAWRYLPADDGE